MIVTLSLSCSIFRYGDLLVECPMFSYSPTPSHLGLLNELYGSCSRVFCGADSEHHDYSFCHYDKIAE